MWLLTFRCLLHLLEKNYVSFLGMDRGGGELQVFAPSGAQEKMRTLSPPTEGAGV